MQFFEHCLEESSYRHLTGKLTSLGHFTGSWELPGLIEREFLASEGDGNFKTVAIAWLSGFHDFTERYNTAPKSGIEYVRVTNTHRYCFSVSYFPDIF